MSTAAPTTATNTTNTATSAPVSLQIPGFLALSEQGHWQDCGLIAEAAALQVCGWDGTWGGKAPQGCAQFRNAVYNSQIITRWHNEYLAARRPDGSPRFDHGTELRDIDWHLTTHGAHIAEYLPSADVVTAATLDANHAFIKRHGVARNPVIIFISRAYNLTRNEGGVNGHFVTLGGIDSDRGYLTANGDTLDGLTSAIGAVIPLQWNSWDQLAAAHINGCIALQRTWTPPTPPAPPAPPPPAPDLQALAKNVQTALDALTAALPVK